MLQCFGGGKLAHLRIEFALLRVGFVAVRVEAYRGTAAPRAAQAENDAGPVLEDDTDSLHKEGQLEHNGILTHAGTLWLLLSFVNHFMPKYIKCFTIVTFRKKQRNKFFS